jgi:hypothetical protein
MPFIAPSRPFDDWPQPGDVLPDGRIVTNRFFDGLQVLDADAQALLARVADRVFADAEDWEESHKGAEREVVREHVRVLQKDSEEIATAQRELTGEATTEADVLRRLLRASLNPLSGPAGADVMMMARNLKAYRDQQHAFDKAREDFMTEVRASGLLSDESLDDLFGPLPQHEF